MKVPHDKAQRDIATRKEIDRLKRDRRNDPPVVSHNYPKPSWAPDPQAAIRRQIRMRERRIRKLEHRLDGSKKTMERDFDQSF